jgi:hypothetical protein
MDDRDPNEDLKKRGAAELHPDHAALAGGNIGVWFEPGERLAVDDETSGLELVGVHLHPIRKDQALSLCPDLLQTRRGKLIAVLIDHLELEPVLRLEAIATPAA